MGGFVQKIIALSCFLIMATAISPLFVSSQSNEALSVRVDDLKEKYEDLKTMPRRMAVVEEKLDHLINDQVSQQAMMRTGVVGIVMLFLEKFVSLFGIGIRLKKKEDQ